MQLRLANAASQIPPESCYSFIRISSEAWLPAISAAEIVLAGQAKADVLIRSRAVFITR